MEFGPILRAMFRNKIGVGLLVIEIALTMAVVVNCLSMVISNRARMAIPTGLDEENILAIRIQSRGEAFDEDAFLRQVIDRECLVRKAFDRLVICAKSSTPRR